MLNKLVQVFTKEYREEVEYQSFMEKMVDKLKIDGGAEDEEEVLKIIAERA